MSSEEPFAFANQPVVLDNGSGTMKAGFAGDEQPKLVFPAFWEHCERALEKGDLDVEKAAEWLDQNSDC